MIIDQSKRTSETIQAIGELFRHTDQLSKPNHLNEVIRAVLHWQQRELTRQGIEIHCELMTNLPLVLGHRTQLEEIIVNLVSNASDALQSINTRTRLLTIRTGLQGRDSIFVELEDNGPGIDPDRLGEIFEAFVTSKTHGTGLGLAICRMIVENHGGELTAASDAKSGTRFRIVLPTVLSLAAANAANESKPAAEPIVSAREA